MLEGLYNQINYQAAKKSLDAAALRQEALASNLANIETRGYKRVDLAADFQGELVSAMGKGSASEITRLKPRIAMDPSALNIRGDGNTVSLDHELLAMNRNALNYQYLTQYVSGSMKRLQTAISGKI